MRPEPNYCCSSKADAAQCLFGKQLKMKELDPTLGNNMAVGTLVAVSVPTENEFLLFSPTRAELMHLCRSSCLICLHLWRSKFRSLYLLILPPFLHNFCMVSSELGVVKETTPNNHHANIQWKESNTLKIAQSHHFKLHRPRAVPLWKL